MTEDRNLPYDFYEGPSTNVTTPTTNGTAFRFWIGVIPLAGLTLNAIVGIDGAALGFSATDYLTFQPLVSVPSGNGNFAVQKIGSPFATSGKSIAADTPFNCHTEADLAYQVPRGAAVGVDITATVGGTLAAQRLCLQAKMVFGR